MKPVAFEYHRPESVAEVVELLDDLEDVKVLAGGQSLVPLMNFRLAAPANLIDISRLGELGHLAVDEAEVVVGAAVTHSQLLGSIEATTAIPLLAEAEHLVAHAVIRNRGTVCGSLAHADPSGELTAVLALLGGSVLAVSAQGERMIEAADLFVGPLQSSLAENELLVEAHFPRLPATATSAIREVARRSGDYAVCGVAVTVDRPDGETIGSAKAAFISVAATPHLIDLDEAVMGRTIDEVDAGDLYDLVSAQLDPSDDIHGTAAYRRHLGGVLVGQAVAACA